MLDPKNSEFDNIDNQHLEKMAQETITELQPLFDEINGISEEMAHNTDINDINRYCEFQDRLTGLYCKININFKRFRATTKNEEVRYFHRLKLIGQANLEKVTDKEALNESEYYVAPLRLTRDILEGYTEVLTTAISTCRSRLYEYKQDQKNEG